MMADHHATGSTTSPSPTDDRDAQTQTYAVSGLTAFQRDILAAVPVSQPHPESDAGRPHGLAVKQTLETWYGHEVNNGRIYPNLEELAESGYIVRETIDKRTKGVRLTDTGAAALEMLRDRYGGALEVADE